MNNKIIRNVLCVVLTIASVLYMVDVATASIGTGGIITIDGNYVVHTFTSNGTFIAPSIAENLTVMIVAGGGGGGAGSTNTGGAGGGAGGFILNTSYPVTALQSISVVVGYGGSGGAVDNLGTNGTNSSFNNQKAIGGGGGGKGLSTSQGHDGGSGGGGAYTAGGNGVSGQGHDGGSGSGGALGGGGGANATGASSSNPNLGGAGGIGYLTSINGTAGYYAGGGGGSVDNTGTGGAGGLGGGAAGADGGNVGNNAINFTGGGGGGGSGSGAGKKAGGNGAYGIVIIRYLNPNDFIPIAASDRVQYSNDSEVLDNTNGLHKVKQINISESYSGSWKINYDIQYPSGSGTDKSRIYKNGVPYGTLNSWVPTVYPTITETFSGISINKNDTIELWVDFEGLGGTHLKVKNFRVLFDYDYASGTPNLIYPVNASTISFIFPPQVADINFTWRQIGASGYQIQVAKDINFNLIVADTTTQNPYKVIALEASTYYWHVRTYNDAGDTLGGYSATSTFIFSSNTPSVPGTVVNGIVYENLNGISTPINGATVYISNSTATYQSTTGTNGYYQFIGLSNLTVYSMYSLRQGYDNSQVLLVTPTFSATTTINIPMTRIISPFVPNFVYERLIFVSMYGGPYIGSTVNVFIDGNVNPTYTGVTDSTGSVVFQLIKDTYYRFEVSGGGLSSTVTFYLYGKEETQTITVTSGFPTGSSSFNDINATLFVTYNINATYSALSLYYNDNTSTTSIINFYAKNLTTGVYVCANQTSALQTVTLTCNVPSAGSYQWGYNATTSTYGYTHADSVVNFANNNLASNFPIISANVPASILSWISVIAIIFVAGLFSKRTLKYGVIIVPGVAGLLWVLGFYGDHSATAGIITMIAFVIGVLMYMRMSEKELVT